MAEKKKAENSKKVEKYMYMGPRITGELFLIPNTIYKGLPKFAEKDDNLKKMFIKIDKDFGRNRMKFKKMEDDELKKAFSNVVKRYIKKEKK